jgi:triacylglycerol lipase
MPFDKTWESLLQPGRANDFFAAPNPAAFEIAAPAYSAVNAWWLAEISRLVYREGIEEDPRFAGNSRRRILNAVQLDEHRFIHHPRAQCAIVKPLDLAAPQFVVLVFRGTHNLLDWLTNLETVPVAAPPPAPGRVHEGFMEAFASVESEIDSALAPFTCPAFYTGHSLGAALATLAASRRPPRALYTYGSPRVGDAQFLATLGGTRVYRVVDSRDVVATVPPPQLGFAHVGELHYLTRDGRILVDPTDQQKDPPQLSHFFSNPEHLREPPEDLADHSPINYVTRLRAALP